MISIKRSIIIKRSVEDTFNFVSNIENFSKWFPAVIKSKKISPGPIRIGTREHETFRAYILLKKENTSVITEYKKNEKISWITTPKNFHISEWSSTYLFQPVNSFTRLTYIINWEPKGYNKFLKPFLIISETIYDVIIPLKKLKKILES